MDWLLIMPVVQHLETDNATSATPRDEVEEYFNEQGNGTSHANTVTRDSQTILLEGETLPEGRFYPSV